MHTQPLYGHYMGQRSEELEDFFRVLLFTCPRWLQLLHLD